MGEAVRPVASPAFIEQHQQVLAGDVSGWRALPFLELSKHNYGWATWNDWFEATSNPGIAPEFEYFSNYVYLLEAAAAGKGLALGWQVLVERHLQTGSLQPVVDDCVVFDRAIYAMLTTRGREKSIARRFLNTLDSDWE
ncbi:MAG: hypothetical protein GY896_16160 [Gammaproteobacteria bacterium]|nr:hypothetical protein [Gammaproteobacteria bacterium]